MGAIMCPRCDTHYAGQQVGDLRQTYIAFRVDEGQGARWASFCDLMTREGRADGLHPVPHNPRSLDRATLDVLTQIVAHADRAGFHSSCLRARAKILWIGGKAAGFYTYQYPGDFAVDAPWKMNIEGYQVERAVPSLNHIYILRGYRRVDVYPPGTHIRNRGACGAEHGKAIVETLVGRRKRKFVHVLAWATRQEPLFVAQQVEGTDAGGTCSRN